MTKLSLVPFYFNDICLTLISIDVLNDTLYWRNVYREWFNHHDEITLDRHLAWYQHYLSLNNDFVFIVENKQQEKVGQTAIYHIDWDGHEGEFGRIVVNPRFAGQGYMRDACQATILLATQILKLQRLYLTVKETNKRAIELYDYCGFVKHSHDDTYIKMTFEQKRIAE